MFFEVLGLWLGSCWGHVGAKSAQLGPSWGMLAHVGPWWLILRRSWAHMEGSWSHLGASWGHFGSKKVANMAPTWFPKRRQIPFKNDQKNAQNVDAS